MACVPGATAAETRERLLRAAADVFAERGYDGTRVADIAAAAGVSEGAMYAHFASKAELLVDALRAHARRLLADVLGADALLTRLATGFALPGITAQTGTTQ